MKRNKCAYSSISVYFGQNRGPFLTTSEGIVGQGNHLTKVHTSTIGLRHIQHMANRFLSHAKDAFGKRKNCDYYLTFPKAKVYVLPPLSLYSYAHPNHCLSWYPKMKKSRNGYRLHLQ